MGEGLYWSRDGRTVYVEPFHRLDPSDEIGICYAWMDLGEAIASCVSTAWERVPRRWRRSGERIALRNGLHEVWLHEDGYARVHVTFGVRDDLHDTDALARAILPGRAEAFFDRLALHYDLRVRLDERRARRLRSVGGRSMTFVPPEAPLIVVPGTDACWRGLRGYVAECRRVGDPIRCCRRHYARCARVYRSLDIARDVRASLDLDGLEALAAFLARAGRSGAGVPYGRPFSAEFTRAELGVLRMAVGNRIGTIRSGRAADPRLRGPRMDPARLPDATLDRLIQSHPDLALVDRLRAERARRHYGDRP